MVCLQYDRAEPWNLACQRVRALRSQKISRCAVERAVLDFAAIVVGGELAV